jgi:hypothetical protein
MDFSGCLLDPAIRDATAVDLIASGAQPICGDNPQIKGAWAAAKARGVKAILLFPLMQKYFPNRKNDFQNGTRGVKPAPDHGTCVSRGTYRAAMMSMLRQLDEQQIVGRPAILAYEFIYGYGRTIYGKNQLGNGGGMYGGWAAKVASLMGIPERGKYGSVDLSADTPMGRTDLAVQWGTDRRGPPQEVIEAAKGHTFDAHLASNPEDVADALACGFAGAFSRSWAGTGQRDKNGMVRPTPSAHCETLAGIFVAANGDDGYLHWQSWGENTPSGNNILRLQDGSEIPLPPGAYGVYRSDMDRAFRSGDAESWHFECREGGQFR